MTTKPKHLTLRPAEVARFLRPSGLVVIPLKDQPGIVHAEWVGLPPSAVMQWSQWDSVTSSKRPLTCPLGGPGDQWVGREAFIPCRSIGFPCKPSEASYVCFRDGEQQYRDGKHSKWTLKDPPNWKAERHVFLPARRMPLWAARIRKTTTRVELRRVNTITNDECELLPIEPDRATDHPRGVWYTAFMAEFNARYPGSWDRDDYAWFVFYTDTL